MPEHSPEPWALLGQPLHEDDEYIRIVDGDGLHIFVLARDAPSPDNPTAPLGRPNILRAIACVNFCREFDTEFLQHQRLRKMKPDDEVSTAADIPNFEGFVAVELLPVVKENPNV